MSEMKFGTVLPNGATVVQASAREYDSWILLCFTGDEHYQPWVTWVCSRPGNGRDTANGHYFIKLEDAVVDFNAR